METKGKEACITVLSVGFRRMKAMVLFKMNSAGRNLFASCLIAVAAVLGACTDDVSGDTVDPGWKDALIRFEIKTGVSGVTTRTVEDSKIHDLHVLVYNSLGELTGKSYSTFTGTDYTVSVLARSGTGCRIYAVANTGNSALFDGTVANTEEKLKLITTDALTWSTFNSGTGDAVYLPMCGSTIADIATGSSILSGGITVKRLMAQVTLDVSIASGSGITISGYRIYGLPKKSYYVAHPLDTEDSGTDTNTARAADACLPANASDWTDSGLLSPTTTTTISKVFYMYENRPGVNSSITAQSNKTKAYAGTVADSAAYVVIYGKGIGYNRLSWKIYLGTNNTSNFNLKRNSQYICNITLKANDSDTRITYRKSIWAGSNIYWDGTKLTFDTEETTANNKKQGVFFKWGSLIGISPNGTDGSAFDNNSSARLYIPPSGGTLNNGSSWTDTTTGSSITWTNIPYMDPTDATINLNDISQNTTANYATYKGDICQYLSKTGAVSGSWRMPTIMEFNTTNTGIKEPTGWRTTGTTTWEQYGSYPSTPSSGDANGQSPMSWGATYTYNGSGTSFPASGYRNTSGVLYSIGQKGSYWSSSAGSVTNGFHLYFYSDDVYPENNDPRQNGIVVRCVWN